jgi:hypothetical protein
VIFFSCTENGKRKIFDLKKTNPPSLIHNHLLFSDFSNEFSFPIWFNDSMIRTNKIKKITRNIYPKRLLNKAINDTLFQMPSETVIYEFGVEGNVEKVSHLFFFDDRKISQFEYVYPYLANNTGFASVRLDSMVVFKDKIPVSLNTIRDLELFALYNFKKSDKGFSIFENRMTGDFLFCLSDKKLWRPLEIDREFRPNPKDLILLGNPLKPEKIYQVKNKINEKNVQQFNYKNGSIQVIRKDAYPFNTARYFTYDKIGYCTGYIDSTFSEDTFLTRTLSNFENNIIFSPTKILNKKENSDGKMILINYQEFIYEYRK